MSKKKETEYPWWTLTAFSKHLKTDEWKEPMNAFIGMIGMMRELSPWLKLVMGSASFFMISAGLSLWPIIWAGLFG